MNQHEAPVGTLATIGPPANDVRVVKTGAGWRYLHDDRPVDPEDFRAGWDTIPVAVPEEDIAKYLYDQLTGRHTGSPDGENAALADVRIEAGSSTARDVAIARLRSDAGYYGLELHYRSGCRWSLAQRLATGVAAVIAAQR